MRLSRGDLPVNGLDGFCKEHDIEYSQHQDLAKRHEADKRLADSAWTRVFAKDSTVGERIAAWGVTNAMKAKVKLGMGIKRKRSTSRKSGGRLNRMSTGIKKRCTGSGIRRTPAKNGKGIVPFPMLVKMAKFAISRYKPKTAQEAIKTATDAVRSAKVIARSTGKIPEVVSLPKTGGILPLIPIFAGLSALGALSGGAAGIAKAVNSAKSAQKELAEAQRHNRTLEAIAMGKGLYVRPYKTGYGLFIRPPKN